MAKEIFCGSPKRTHKFKESSINSGCLEKEHYILEALHYEKDFTVINPV